MAMMTEQEKQAILKEYAVGRQVKLGRYAGEDIAWQVLEEQGKMRFLLASRILVRRPYNERYVDTSWRECSLRRWLNGEFLREAFSLEERTKILNTRVDNPPNPTYCTNGGMGSVDKLFTLSLGEVKMYLPADEARVAGDWWWLRSPGSNLLSAASVYKDGSVYDTGINIDFTGGGVRPAMWLLLRV